MNKDKGNLLDAFYNTPQIHSEKPKAKMKVVTYSLKEAMLSIWS